MFPKNLTFISSDHLKYYFNFFHKINNKKLGIYSEGNFFGEEELLKEIPRQSSIQCLSNDGELFFLNKKVFNS